MVLRRLNDDCFSFSARGIALGGVLWLLVIAFVFAIVTGMVG
jgi:hypothetical protein